MDEVVALAGGNVEELIKHIDTLKAKEICSYLEKSVTRRSENCLELLEGLFKGLPCSNEIRIEKRKAVYSKALGLLQRGQLSNAVAIGIFGVLVSETNHFPALILVDLSTEFIDSIKLGSHPSGRWIELYPQILSSVAAHVKVLFKGEYLSGSDYKSQIIGELCTAKWPKDYVIQMIIMFKDIILSSDELEMIFDKILRMLPDLDHGNVPSVIYQMLVLSFKGHRRQLLTGLCVYFCKQEARAEKNRAEHGQRDAELDVDGIEFCEADLYRCEGTSLVHCLFAMKYDQELGKELVKLVQANRFIPEDIFSPFPFALALAVSSVEKLQPPIFECLRTALVRHCNEVILRKNVHWMRKMTRDSQTFSAQEAIALVVARSVGGWDCVLEGLLDFAFSLLDAFGVKAGGPGKSRIASEMVCALATDVVLRIFKGCSTSRHSIVQKLFDRIKPSASPSIFVEILSRTVRLIPHAYLSSSGCNLMQGVLDNLIKYPVATARDVLAAVRPLLDLNSSLLDAVVLTLRKAIFSKQVDGRRIAIVGFLACINNARALGSAMATNGPTNSQSSMGSSSSQVHASMHVARNTSTEEGLGLELLGMLKRSLSQQAEVRTMFYQGLPAVITKNPYLTPGTLDLLLAHVHIFVKPGSVPPLELDSCVRLQGTQVVLLEPLPHMLLCASRCLAIAKAKHLREVGSDNGLDSDDEEEWTDPLVVVLKETAAALAKLDLEDFALDKATDYNLNTVAGMKKAVQATLLLGVYETLMEFVYLFDGYSSESANQIALMYESHRKLSSLLREKGATKKGRKKNDNDDSVDAAKTDATTTAHKHPMSEFKHVFSEEFLVKILTDLRNDAAERHQEALDILRDVPGFEQFLVNIAMQVVNDVLVGGLAAGTEEGFRFCSSVGLLFFRRYSASVEGRPATKKAAEIAAKLKFLEGFVTTLTVITEKFAKQLPTFLNALVSANEDPNNLSWRCSQSQRISSDPSLHDVLGKLKAMVTAALLNDDGIKFKELILLFRSISLLIEFLEPDSAIHESATKWVNTLAVEKNFDDVTVAKSLITLLSMLSLQSNKHLALLGRLCEDAHIALNDIDQDVDKDGDTEYSVVTAANAPTTILIAAQNLDAVVVNVSWVVAGATSRLATKHRSGLLSEKKTKMLCECLAQVANSLMELLQTRPSVGPGIDQVIKLATRFYTVMAEFTKYQVAACAIPNNDLSPHFQKIVSYVNSTLSSCVYTFVNYVNTLTISNDVSAKKSAPQVSDKKLLKVMGMMVFSLEKFETIVILLEKKSKVTLTRQMKMNTNRDFKIDVSVIRDALTNQSDTEEEEEVVAEEMPTSEPTRESTAPPTKKRRVKS